MKLTLFLAVLILTMPLSISVAAIQQPSGAAQSRNADLERQKLELEIANLQTPSLTGWVAGAFGIVVGIVGAASTTWVARRTRFGALDQSVHEQRLKLYPRLVKVAAPLALYFPEHGSPSGSIQPQHCAAMGHALSHWYFNGGGLLLSKKSRKAYFRFARALTRASQAGNICTPTFPDDADDISLEKVDDYRQKLSVEMNLDDTEGWSFGACDSGTREPHKRFKDYIFLQRLSSTLRTALASDLRSRRTPW